jgi:hypothetical protein
LYASGVPKSSIFDSRKSTVSIPGMPFNVVISLKQPPRPRRRLFFTA